MTMVRMKVAKSALTFSTPTLAKIAVRAAKPAERSAQNGQLERKISCGLSWPSQPDQHEADKQSGHRKNQRKGDVSGSKAPLPAFAQGHGIEREGRKGGETPEQPGGQEEAQFLNSVSRPMMTEPTTLTASVP
jgi:hypothetical protein